jgi:uncharacterized protein (TIGR02757 family)
MPDHPDITSLKPFLDAKVKEYEIPDFILSDPIQVPHRFSRKEDIEISSFLTATIAWGNRKSIINNSFKLIQLMNNSPYSFILHASETEIGKLASFRHRTFGGDDIIWFIYSLRNIYNNHGGLEEVFAKGYNIDNSVYSALKYFRSVFLETYGLTRSRKHVSNVMANSAAKRLNLMLMWLVRSNAGGVHFGIWEKIPASALMIPLDVHIGRVSRRIGLLSRKADDWKSVIELTTNLQLMDPRDPVKYDFALFGTGISEKN